MDMKIYNPDGTVSCASSREEIERRVESRFRLKDRIFNFKPTTISPDELSALKMMSGVELTQTFNRLVDGLKKASEDLENALKNG